MSASRVLDIGKAILAKNQGLADLLRTDFTSRGVFAVNVVSSPGSGKTEFLARTLDRLAGQIPTGVIVGDLATDRDAQRLSGKGAGVLQVNTDGYCHLEANMVRVAVDELGIDKVKLLIIENVGNLVCPSSHDLGEDLRVVLFCVTEGEDKPLKYPTIFKSSQVVIVSKCDLADAVGFDRETALKNVSEVAPQATIIECSARTQQGMDEWCELLTAAVRAKAGTYHRLPADE